jgi:tetrapyrrole methylase family protein/MazG family protein
MPTRSRMRGESFYDLVELIARLRDPENGCPWDRAQDHASLRPYMLEEAYETIAAIDSGDDASIVDELGDVLLQVVLHSQIASERGAFTITDVIKAIAEKLERRHPHVFGEASDDLPSISRRWRETKEDEGRPRTVQPILVRAKRLLYSLDIQGKADALQDPPLTSSDEERAGVRILVEILEAMQNGFDPEIALLKSVERLERFERQA